VLTSPRKPRFLASRVPSFLRSFFLSLLLLLSLSFFLLLLFLSLALEEPVQQVRIERTRVKHTGRLAHLFFEFCEAITVLTRNAPKAL
jgi:hypothetical protein